MKPLANIKAVIFDMDGVLWLSSPIHAQAYAEVLARACGLPHFDYAPYAGMRTDECLRQVLTGLGQPCDDDLIARLAAHKSGLAYALLQQSRPVHPQAGRVLPVLARRCRLALASSASARGLELFLAASGLAACFAAKVHGAQVPRAKPAPDIYLEAARRLGLEAPACLVVEDAPAGVEAGRAAGMAVVGLAGLVLPEDLLGAGACAVLEDLAGLLDLVPEP